MSPRENAWIPADIGTKGRRAQAWFVTDGLVVAATDADVAGHAMAEVMEALTQTAQLVDPRFHTWCLELIAEFPDLPDEACTAHELERGTTDVDLDKAIVGVGYVRPVGGGHECLGAIFDRTTHGATEILPHRIWLSANRAVQ